MSAGLGSRFALDLKMYMAKQTTDSPTQSQPMPLAFVVFCVSILGFRHDYMKHQPRVTTPSSATAEAGALAAWWVARRRRKQPA